MTDTETELYFALVYPPIDCTRLFVDSLPDSVVDSIIIGLKLRDKYSMDLYTKRAYIRIMLRQPINNPKIVPVIWDSLRSYHDIQD